MGWKVANEQQRKQQEAPLKTDHSTSQSGMGKTCLHALDEVLLFVERHIACPETGGVHKAMTQPLQAVQW